MYIGHTSAELRNSHNVADRCFAHVVKYLPNPMADVNIEHRHTGIVSFGGGGGGG